LGSSNLVVFVLLELLPNSRDIFERVEHWKEIGQSFTGSVVGIDDKAEVPEIVLESDGKRLSLYKSGLFEVVFFKQLEYLFFKRVVLKLCLFGLGL
jgi:hypothetical protein